MRPTFHATHQEAGWRDTRSEGELAVLPRPMEHTFARPFQLEDLLAFDQANLCRVLGEGTLRLAPQQLAWSMHGVPPRLAQRLLPCLAAAERPFYLSELSRSVPESKVEEARRLLLDTLFWELTYWKTPELYEELTVGEQLHPGIFQQLEPLVQDKIVLDAGAGSGRASFEAVGYGARLVYAVEPSPGLLHLLRQKLERYHGSRRIIPCRGDFAHLPCVERRVDLALSCSAFTSDAAQGGEPGLAELRRVTRPGGYIVVIWPRVEDRLWLAEHGFHYVALPGGQQMGVRFASHQSALCCARRFYTHNQPLLSYLLNGRRSEVPFSVLGFNPPCDYCWLQVT